MVAYMGHRYGEAGHWQVQSTYSTSIVNGAVKPDSHQKRVRVVCVKVVRSRTIDLVHIWYTVERFHNGVLL